MQLKNISQNVCGRTITLRVPSDPEEVLSHAVESESENSGDSDPYWCLVWDAAPKTAAAILKSAWTAAGQHRALELGCGVGLAGIAGLMAGLDVTFSDYSANAVEQALQNAAVNGFPNCTGLVLDWNVPSTNQFELIIASDILYDRNNHLPVINVLHKMLRENGEAWIGDMGRQALPEFVQCAKNHNWEVNITDEAGKPLAAAAHQQFQLLTLRKTG